ncbi:TPA: hypothetical protein ACV439_005080 [Bacillus toyonensis]
MHKYIIELIVKLIFLLAPSLEKNRIKWLLGQIEEMDVVNEKKKIEEFFRQLGKEITHLKEYMDSHKEYSALAR